MTNPSYHEDGPQTDRYNWRYFTPKKMAENTFLGDWDDFTPIKSGQIISRRETRREVTFINGGLIREVSPKSPKDSGVGIIRKFAQISGVISLRKKNM